MQDKIMTEFLQPTDGDDLDPGQLLLSLMAADTDPATPRLNVVMGPYTAFVVISFIQLAWRCPGLSEEQKFDAESVGRQIQNEFPKQYRALIERGWDTSQDVEP